MREDNEDPHKEAKIENDSATTRSANPIGSREFAILIAVVLGYLVMQTQKRLETVRSELHKVSENAVQAKARVVDLEQTAAGLKRELKRADFKRNELQDQLKKRLPKSNN